MPHVVGVVIPQVLKASVVGHLAGREKGLGIQVARHHPKAIKPQSRALRSIRKGLRHGEGGGVRCARRLSGTNGAAED